MESKHKNALIGALLAVVFVMAVGYAAFAQTLTINGTATIDSTWDVHFDDSKTEGAGVINAEAGLAGATAPDGGEIGYQNGNQATLSATLHQPGDKVTYTLTILNTGSIDAKLHLPVLTVDGATAGTGTLTQSKGNIQFTVQGLAEGTSLPKNTGSTTVQVIAEYIDTAGNTTSGTQQSATATITIDAYQATA